MPHHKSSTGSRQPDIDPTSPDRNARQPSKLPWRLGLLVGVLALIAAIGVLFRRFGLGEIALLLAFFGLVFAVESGRFIVRQFLKGYRARGKLRD